MQTLTRRTFPQVREHTLSTPEMLNFQQEDLSTFPYLKEEFNRTTNTIRLKFKIDNFSHATEFSLIKHKIRGNFKSKIPVFLQLLPPIFGDY